MVRLEVSGNTPANSFFTSFQFQDGAIRGEKKLETLRTYSTFQFQDGAIRGCVVRVQRCVKHWFQFQDGAIRGLLAVLIAD